MPPLKLVAGADVAYAAGSERVFAAVVVFSLLDLRLVEKAEYTENRERGEPARSYGVADGELLASVDGRGPRAGWL